MKKVFYTPKYPEEPRKGMGYIEIDEEVVKRINIRPIYKAIAYGGVCPVVGPDGVKFYAYLDNPLGFGGRNKRRFTVHSHAEAIQLIAQKKLTIDAVLHFVKSWADKDAKLITPGRRTITLSKEKAESPSYVYFVFNQDSNAVKIGVAKNIQKRLSALQTSSPAKLELLGFIKTNNSRDAKKLEHSLHQKFTALWIMGEWFQCKQELLNYINYYKDL